MVRRGVGRPKGSCLHDLIIGGGGGIINYLVMLTWNFRVEVPPHRSGPCKSRKSPATRKGWPDRLLSSQP